MTDLSAMVKAAVALALQPGCVWRAGGVEGDVRVMLLAQLGSGLCPSRHLPHCTLRPSHSPPHCPRTVARDGGERRGVGAKAKARA